MSGGINVAHYHLSHNQAIMLPEVHVEQFLKY
jgi:hypothetical protein